MIVDQDGLDAAVNRMRAEGTDLWEIEVKRAADGVPDVRETLSAFANMPAGGSIVFGLDEASGFAPSLGVPAAEVRQKVANWARKGLVPEVHVDILDLTVDGRPVVVVDIHPLPSSQKPARVGRSGPAYSRLDDGDYPLSEAEVQQILARRERPRADLAPVPGTSAADLDPDLLDQFMRRVRRTSRRLAALDDVGILRARRVLAPDGTALTKAGLYALGYYPQTFFPHLTITAVRHSAVPGHRNADRQEFDGPIPSLLTDAMEWVMRNVRSTVRERPDGHLEDQTELPAVAVRELVANALVHRDLSDHTSSRGVFLHLDHRRLHIESPGGLWGISLRELGRPAGKSAVNEHLYDLCQMISTPDGSRVIEGEGGGIAAARTALLESGMRPPELHATEVRFVADVPRESLLSEEDLAWVRSITGDGVLSPVQRSLAVGMRHGRVWTNQDVRDEFGLDSVKAREALRGLVQAGLAETDGERRSTRYSLSRAAGGSTPRRRMPTIFDILEDTDDDVATTRPSTARRPTAAARNGELLLRALEDGPRSAAALTETTGLSPRQVSYALRKLIEQDRVRMNGRQGARGTTYATVPESSARER